jgi:hypothetical protein
LIKQMHAIAKRFRCRGVIKLPVKKMNPGTLSDGEFGRNRRPNSS